MASVIPMRQPILVGHHSEGRNRRYREKIWNTTGKSVKAQGKAGYYADKAESDQKQRCHIFGRSRCFGKVRGEAKGLADGAGFYEGG